MARKKKTNSNAREVQNAAKTLFANIRFMSPDNPVRSLVMTSAVPNEGKTRSSFELARAIATSGKSVLLVDADMRRRSIASLLDVHPAKGLYAVLSDEVPLEAAVVATQIPNLFFLDSEPGIPNPADIVSSKSFRRLAYKLEENYDYVVYDTPPLGPFVDAAILSTLVDGTILVVKPGAVKRSELMDAYEQLKKAGSNVLGICATFCETTSSEYYYAYYTKDGKRVDPTKTEAPAVPEVADAAVRPASAPAGKPAGNRAVYPGQRRNDFSYAAPPAVPRGSHMSGRGRAGR